MRVVFHMQMHGSHGGLFLVAPIAIVCSRHRPRPYCQIPATNINLNCPTAAVSPGNSHQKNNCLFTCLPSSVNMPGLVVCLSHEAATFITPWDLVTTYTSLPERTMFKPVSFRIYVDKKLNLFGIVYTICTLLSTHFVEMAEFQYN